MVPRSIGGLEVVGIIGTDGDVVTYAGAHPEHGTVAITTLSAAAAQMPGAVEEYLAECARRANDPAEADVQIAHGLDGELPYAVTRIKGVAPTIHPLPPPVNRMRRAVALGLVLLLVAAVVLSVLRSADVVTLSPDERSWAVDLDGEWERTDDDTPLSLTAAQQDGTLVARGTVHPDAPNSRVALEAIRSSMAAAASFVDVELFDEPWTVGADVVTADGSNQLVRLVDRPCAAFVLTIESTDGAFDAPTAEAATDVAASFRRIGIPPTFEKGAEAPAGFTDVTQNGIRVAVPADAAIDPASTDCVAATLANGAQTMAIRWIGGQGESSRLAEWQTDLEAAGGEVVSEGLTSRGKQRRVATTDAGSIVLYVIEDDSGVYSLAFSVPGVAELGASDLVVFDLIASTFEVTGTSEDPS